MSDMQRLLDAIQKRLPQDQGKSQLITAVELVWTRKLGATRGTGLLIVTTPRELTPNGGNGWTGFDGIDFRIVDAAISAALEEEGATGMIDRFIVRAQRSQTTISDADIDALFD